MDTNDTGSTLNEILERGGSSSAIGRDLRLNLVRLLSEGALSAEESLLALLATASSVRHKVLIEYAQEQLAANGVGADKIHEARESAAIMAMLNTYYRFKHMVAKDDDYRSAGLRMTGLSRPALGRHAFEMLAFAVSVLNGCESCIRSHEETLRGAEISVDKIHDLARMAAVVKGLRALEQ